MNTKEEIDYITEIMHKHENTPILVEQLHAMLNNARQRFRQQQYESYFINRK